MSVRRASVVLGAAVWGAGVVGAGAPAAPGPGLRPGTRARSARARSAEAALVGARYRFRYERAALAFDADTTYTRALVAIAHARLSRRNALDTDSLLAMAVTRRDA